MLEHENTLGRSTRVRGSRDRDNNLFVKSHRGSYGLQLAALRTIVSRVRCSEWAVGLSLTVTRRRAAMGGFTQDG
jgi:hypothetical protein